MHEQNTQGGGSFDYSIDVAHEFAPDRTSHVLLFFLVFFQSVFLGVSCFDLYLYFFINQKYYPGTKYDPNYLSKIQILTYPEGGEIRNRNCNDCEFHSYHIR